MNTADITLTDLHDAAADIIARWDDGGFTRDDLNLLDSDTGMSVTVDGVTVHAHLDRDNERITVARTAADIAACADWRFFYEYTDRVVTVRWDYSAQIEAFNAAVTAIRGRYAPTGQKWEAHRDGYLTNEVGYCSLAAQDAAREALRDWDSLTDLDAIK